jgi:hypothetical protein
LAAAAAIMFANSLLVGFVGRYMLDFMVFIVLPSLFCAHYWCAAGVKIRLGIVYGLLAASVFVGLFLFVSGQSAHPHSDPVLYRYLECSLGIIRDI